MTRNEWLRKEIHKWEHDGILKSETAERLSAMYLSDERRVPTAVMILGCFGAILLALGIIALLAANWDCFGRPIRAFISVMPLILCGAVALAASVFGWKSRNLWEPLGILWSAAMCTGILMITQIYQVTESFPDYVLVCAASILPVVYVTHATVPLAIWPGLLAIGVCSKWEHEYQAAVIYWLLFLMVIPAIVNYWRKIKSPVGRGIVDLGISLATTIGGTIAMESFVCEQSSVAAIFLLSSLPAVIMLAGVRFKMPMLCFAGLGYLVVYAAVTLPYESILNELFIKNCKTGIFDVNLQIVLYTAALAVIGISLFVSIILTDGMKPLLFFAALPLFSVTLAPIGIAVKSSGLLSFFGLAVIIAYGLGTLVNGLKSQRLILVNFGVAMIFYAILAKFFASDIGFAMKGIVMSILGAIVLIMNTAWYVVHTKHVRSERIEVAK